jgi:stage V sporulation protein G
MEITEVKIFHVNEDKLKAYVTIVLDHCFVVRDLKIINGSTGLFVAMPSKKRSDGSYKDVAHPLNKNTRVMMEKKILERFFTTLGKHSSKAAYGEERVNLALERGAAELILISNKLEKAKIAEFEKKAEDISAEVVLISTETQEGEQFLNLTKGLAAILRFALE